MAKKEAKSTKTKQGAGRKTSTKDTAKKTPPKVKEIPPYKLTIGIVRDKKYTFDREEDKNLDKLLATAKKYVLKYQGKGLREIQLSVSKKMDVLK